MIRRPPRSTLFPTRRSSDLQRVLQGDAALAGLLECCADCLLKLLAKLVHVHDADLTSPEFAGDADRPSARAVPDARRSEEHTSELQSPCNLVCRLLLEKKKN